MKMPPRPEFIAHWRDLEPASPAISSAGEEMGYMASFSDATGLSRLKIAHLRLQPGARSNVPGAYRDEEEFFFVVEGRPELWVDGYLHQLHEGDGVAFNDKTGIAHTIVNNTERDVRLFVFGEATRMRSQFFAALPEDAKSNEFLKGLGKLWENPPKRKLGPHDAISDKRRGRSSPANARKRGQPDYVANWQDIIETKPGTYPNSNELQGLDALFGRRARFSRIGIHFEVLKPGRRTSWPHAERDEEEFVFVAKGRVDAWNDGWVTPLQEGDFIGWEAGTGITHVIMNNSNSDALLLVGGEASRVRNQFWYPFHPKRNKEVGALYWDDHPEPKLGPHDGLPDALRAALPPKARKNAMTVNAAAVVLKPAKASKKKKSKKKK
jgi:uncharacterized cupin superfamily protein